MGRGKSKYGPPLFGELLALIIGCLGVFLLRCVCGREKNHTRRRNPARRSGPDFRGSTLGKAFRLNGTHALPNFPSPLRSHPPSKCLACQVPEDYPVYISLGGGGAEAEVMGDAKRCRQDAYFPNLRGLELYTSGPAVSFAAQLIGGNPVVNWTDLRAAYVSPRRALAQPKEGG